MILDVIELEFIMILLALVGFWARRSELITKEGQTNLTTVLTEIILPCNVLSGYMQGSDTLQKLKACLPTFAVSVGLMFVCVLLGRLVFGSKGKKVLAVTTFGLINSNSVFVGLPVMQSLLGAEGVLQQSVYMIFPNLFIWSYGVSLFTADGGGVKQALKKVTKNRLMIAIFIGFVILITGIQVPSVISRSLNYIGSCLMAISMMLIGCVLAKSSFKNAFSPLVLQYTVMRLLVIPAIVFAVCFAAQLNYSSSLTCVMLSCMPAAAMTAVLAVQYDCDGELGSMIVAVSTLFSVVSIPLWYMAAQLLR